ncbi:DUF1853 family protein [Phytohalomonas tamaricis]|uniref:DUF1853 family protein n=1 Tax=Phytohalomonas tamaricis TaxID=2081032 RepID=UPI001319CDBE|nr:DUF1853 family protein [Phytohalomonas tamaricis]
MTGISIDLERYRHPLVRDLAWLLNAPALIKTRYRGRPTAYELGLSEPTAWLDTLESDPLMIEDTLSNSLNRRLGHYHEQLWHVLLSQAPGSTLLTHNLAVYDGKRTLGELDILYREGKDALPTHLEVAIKFYLGLPHGPGPATAQSRWIGAGGIDSLALKHVHLLDHQLPMLRHDYLQPALSDYIAGDRNGDEKSDRPDLPHQRLALLGVLFYPWSSPPSNPSADIAAPQGATAHHLRGDWLPWHAWPAYRSHKRIRRAVRMNKPHWLALPRRENLIDVGAFEDELKAHFAAADFPVQIAIEDEHQRMARAMIVADRWPSVVPLPPRRRPRRRSLHDD